jgi:hypothetical protein
MRGWRVLVGVLALTVLGAAPALARWSWEPGGAGPLSPLGISRGDTGGYDLLYGVRFRF